MKTNQKIIDGAAKEKYGGNEVNVNMNGLRPSQTGLVVIIAGVRDVEMLTQVT